jgi:hypothetical protein
MMKNNFIFIFLIFLFSCKRNDHKNRDLLISLNETIEKSNQLIFEKTKITFGELSGKETDPGSREKALIWQPKAMLIETYTEAYIDFIKQLKNNLIHESALQKNELDPTGMDDIKSVEKIFYREGGESELKKRTEKFRNELLSVDERVKAEFENEIDSTVGFADHFTKKKDHSPLLFQDQTVLYSLAILNRFENNTRQIENKLVTFCYWQVGSLDGHGFFQKFELFVVQESNIVKPGDNVIIHAGIGEIKSEVSPEMRIKGRLLKPDNRGVITYKFKAASQPGAYLVPITIGYSRIDGKRDSMSKNIEYSVFDTTRQ